jgi:tetratricopeptide (TPR) repeat protein
MKKFLILFAILFSTIPLSAQDTIQQANEAYAKGDFQAAANLYESIIRENGASAAIYYNLGNSYYKLNKVASSILNYERAILLDPSDKNIRFNLEIAKLKTVDKIEPIETFFLTEWSHSLQNLFSTDEWCYFGIICFLLMITGLVLFFFSRKIVLKKLGFYMAVVLLVLAITGNIFAHNQKKRLTQRNTAIILVQTTTIKSSPDNSGTDLFILHEGTKVVLKSKLGGWNEIVTADGNVGWIKSGEIEII